MGIRRVGYPVFPIYHWAQITHNSSLLPCYAWHFTAYMGRTGLSFRHTASNQRSTRRYLLTFIKKQLSPLPCILTLKVGYLLKFFSNRMTKLYTLFIGTLYNKLRLKFIYAPCNLSSTHSYFRRKWFVEKVSVLHIRLYNTRVDPKKSYRSYKSNAW